MANVYEYDWANYDETTEEKKSRVGHGPNQFVLKMVGTPDGGVMSLDPPPDVNATWRAVTLPGNGTMVESDSTVADLADRYRAMHISHKVKGGRIKSMTVEEL